MSWFWSRCFVLLILVAALLQDVASTKRHENGTFSQWPPPFLLNWPPTADQITTSRKPKKCSRICNSPCTGVRDSADKRSGILTRQSENIGASGRNPRLDLKGGGIRPGTWALKPFKTPVKLQRQCAIRHRSAWGLPPRQAPFASNHYFADADTGRMPVNRKRCTRFPLSVSPA
jgi:hypothetical protein